MGLEANKKASEIIKALCNFLEDATDKMPLALS